MHIGWFTTTNIDITIQNKYTCLKMFAHYLRWCVMRTSKWQMRNGEESKRRQLKRPHFRGLASGKEIFTPPDRGDDLCLPVASLQAGWWWFTPANIHQFGWPADCARPTASWNRYLPTDYKHSGCLAGMVPGLLGCWIIDFFEQVRSSDGTRLVVKMNEHHTVRDLKQQILSQQETREGRTCFALISVGQSWI